MLTLIIHLANVINYLLTYMLGTIMSVGNAATNKAKPLPYGAYKLVSTHSTHVTNPIR